MTSPGTPAEERCSLLSSAGLKEPERVLELDNASFQEARLRAAAPQGRRSLPGSSNQRPAPLALSAADRGMDFRLVRILPESTASGFGR
ncbi:hypothetical protein [Alkalicoccus urumqiensis]|uniref:Uncharacterized protein n=1 Tax=Alkalicoccus urumqiensis TaxID=1548213 RepID=A0A2P6MLJ2_ALKUR|nr:hypothetical protein [Alkalicoccus urumqiensis]PRO67155.1 hypothetical protein C6I21_00895 [Alkalicoccus urumqiensis]